MKLEEFKIEEWCKEFEKACKKPMNDEQGKAYVYPSLEPGSD